MGVVKLVESETRDARDEIASDSSAAKQDSMFSFGYILIQVNKLYDVIDQCNSTLDISATPPDGNETVWNKSDLLSRLVIETTANKSELNLLIGSIHSDLDFYDGFISDLAQKFDKLSMNIITAARDIYTSVRDDAESGKEAERDSKESDMQLKYFTRKVMTISSEMRRIKTESFQDMYDDLFMVEEYID